MIYFCFCKLKNRPLTPSLSTTFTIKVQTTSLQFFTMMLLMENNEYSHIYVSVGGITYHNFFQILHLELMEWLQEVLLHIIVKSILDICHLLQNIAKFNE
jgi:hypothetical protein